LTNISINWDNINSILKDRYENKVNQEEGMFKFFEFNIENLDWIIDENITTDAYKTFVEEVNELEMSINLFENLLMFEDLRYERDGIEDFPIDMPRKYFRFPALNNPRDMFSQQNFTENEKNNIEKIIKKSQEKMNIRNDENIVREHFLKLEFLSLFSIFEAFLENYYIDYLIQNNPTEDKDKIHKKVSKLIRNNSIDQSLKEILNEVNPELINLLYGLKNDIFNFIYFSSLARNIHTHKLGKVSEHFISQGKQRNVITEQIIKNDKDEIIDKYLYVNCMLGEGKRIKKNKYLTLTEVVALFRSYTNEIAYILEKGL
jgi:hypothetical protein